MINTFDTQAIHTSAAVSELNTQPTLIVSVPIEEKVFVSSTSTQVKQANTILALYPRAYLKIIPVTVSGPTGMYDIYALLDYGSTVTLMDAVLAAQIGAASLVRAVVRL